MTIIPLNSPYLIKGLLAQAQICPFVWGTDPSIADVCKPYPPINNVVGGLLLHLRSTTPYGHPGLQKSFLVASAGSCIAEESQAHLTPKNNATGVSQGIMLTRGHLFDYISLHFRKAGAEQDVSAVYPAQREHR